MVAYPLRCCCCRSLISGSEDYYCVQYKSVGVDGGFWLVRYKQYLSVLVVCHECAHTVVMQSITVCDYSQAIMFASIVNPKIYSDYSNFLPKFV